jgi:hypothetical protein
MPIVIVIVAVLAIIILSKSGVAPSIITLMVPLIFSALGGLATAGVVSMFATPVVGLPVGLMVAVYIFAKLVSKSRS